jgi:hypothetical protein
MLHEEVDAFKIINSNLSNQLTCMTKNYEAISQARFWKLTEPFRKCMI